MARFCSARAAVLAGVGFSAIATWASAAEWRLVDITGAVRIASPGAAPATGRQGQTLPVGTTVTTAAGGRATLDNGDQHIVVGPNSRMTVQPEQGGFTRIAQDLGAAMFKVDKKQVPHFRVDTPLLAAIVKGTTFTVMVEGTSDTVSVAEGLVEVRANNQNGAVGSDVAAGATGTVLRDAPGAVSVTAPGTGVPPAAPAPAAIAPIDYKAASGGLIDAAPSAAANVAAGVAQPAVMRRDDNAGVAAPGVAAQDTAAPGGSAAAAVSQIASVQAAQSAAPMQAAIASASSAGANGNGAGAVIAASNPGNGNSGNGNSGAGANNGVGNGNGGANNGNGANTNAGQGGGVITTVSSTVGGLADAAGLGNSGNGNSGPGNNNGNGNGAGNSGNGNANGNNGNANGNSGGGNG